MTELPKSTRLPFFLECAGRRLFSIFHAPQNRGDIHGGAVYFAPFAEEANRARRMASLLAETLGRTGTGTLLFDYASTGDSTGDFAQARWDDWVEDGCATIEWLHREIDKPIALVGLRLGAVLALECARKVGIDIPRIVLWQPATSGRTLFTQFLRIRLAASLAAGGERESSKDLLARLADGETLEVAGYEIAPALADAINSAAIADIVPPLSSKLHWLEVMTGGEGALMEPSQKIISNWRGAGIDVASSVIEGEQFWATQEITTAPDLIDATRTAITGSPT